MRDERQQPPVRLSECLRRGAHVAQVRRDEDRRQPLVRDRHAADDQPGAHDHHQQLSEQRLLPLRVRALVVQHGGVAARPIPRGDDEQRKQNGRERDVSGFDVSVTEEVEESRKADHA